MVEEAGVPGENHDHGEATGKLYQIYKAGHEPTSYW